MNLQLAMIGCWGEVEGGTNHDIRDSFARTSSSARQLASRPMTLIEMTVTMSGTPGLHRNNRAVNCSPCFVHRLRRPIGHDATTNRVALPCS